MAKEMTQAELEEFLKIPPEEHFRSREKAIKAAGVWKALADATTDPKVKAQWQKASDNAIRAAENMSPAKIHNTAISTKKQLREARGQLGDSEEEKRVGAVVDASMALMDMLINKPPKKPA